MEGGAGAGSRTTRFMMEGVGARVIRGPDWKWGKQVRFCIYIYICIVDVLTSFGFFVRLSLRLCTITTVSTFRMEAKVMSEP